MTESKFATVQHSEEDPVVAGFDEFPEFGDLFGFRNGAQVLTLGILGLYPQRAATEKPHRPIDQESVVSSHKLRRLLQPVHHIDCTPDHKGVIVASRGSVFARIDNAAFMAYRLQLA